MERLRGMTAPIVPGPPAGGIESPAQEAVVAYGAPAGDGCPHKAGPLARGTGSLAPEAVAAYGAPAKDSSPDRRGPTSWGDGESDPRGARCLWSACGGL